MAVIPALCERAGIPRKELSPAFLDMITTYRWPGNVRELMHMLEFSVNAACYESTLFPVHLPPDIRAEVLRQRLSRQQAGRPVQEADAPPLMGVPSPPPPLSVFRDEVWGRAEKAYLTRLLEECNGDLNRACTVADVSQSRLYALIKKYGLTRQTR